VLHLEGFLLQWDSVFPYEQSRGQFAVSGTVLTTAILNAGRISLDEKREVKIEKDGDAWKLI